MLEKIHNDKKNHIFLLYILFLPFSWVNTSLGSPYRLLTIVLFTTFLFYTSFKIALPLNKRNYYRVCQELYALAKEKNLILMDAIKTAYSTAYERLLLMAKGGKIGKVVSIDAVCTSLRDGISIEGADLSKKWNSMCGWAPAAMLPVFQIFGTKYTDKVFYTKYQDKDENIDAFTKIDFVYPSGVATVKVAKGAKAEGELVIAGTKGYIYVPAPWWKTDYFEVRYENQEDNKRFFYQLEGEGIRYEIVAFAKAIESGRNMSYISVNESSAIVGVIEDFNNRIRMIEIE